MTPKEIQDFKKLEVQVRWLNEQLEGHEDNFTRQFDKIEQLKELLTMAKTEIERQIMDLNVERAKFSSLASYVAHAENTTMNKILRPPNHDHLKIVSAITAYKAATYEMFFKELKTLLALGEDDDDVRLQLYDELMSLTQKIDDEVDKHVRKLSEQV